MRATAQSTSSRGNAKAVGFTLVEILIVISIIAILSSVVLSAISIAADSERESRATFMLSSIRTALENYVMDEGAYPARGRKPDPERNDFPALWSALMDGDTPYLDVPVREDVVVRDGTEHRSATRLEFWDKHTEKNILDPWSHPYVYRCNKGLPRKSWMVNPKGVDLYSLGPNGRDDTALGFEGEENDDIYR